MTNPLAPVPFFASAVRDAARALAPRPPQRVQAQPAPPAPKYAADAFTGSQRERPDRISRMYFGAGGRDGDGLTRKEFRQADANGDGLLTHKEFRQADRGKAPRARQHVAQAPAEPAPAPAPPTLPYTTAFPHAVPELARDLQADEAALRAANGWGPETTDVPGGTPIQVPDTPGTRGAMAGLGQPPAPAPGEPPGVPATGPAAPPASPSTAHLLGAMTAEQIEDVLVARGSRMAGQGFGPYILDMERQYGVPAVQFLAMATMESQIGGDDGYAQPGHNVGNIRPGDGWTGPVVDGPYGKFRVYDSWEAGINDYFKLLAGPIYAGKTLQDQVYTYAPPSDGNDSAHYLDTVRQLILQWSGLSA